MNDTVMTADGMDDEQWDVVRTMSELEELQAHTERVIKHTMKPMSRPVGTAPHGEMLFEHPLGMSIRGIEEALNACYRKYGKDMRMEAMFWNGAIEVAPKPPKRDERGRFTK